MALNMKKYCPNELNNDKLSRLEHRFLVLRKLGQGTYGKVQLALNKETNEEVAVKTIKKVKIENEEDMLRIRREIHIMSSLQHPHIIHIHEVFETRQKIVIVMQYASGGELYDYLGCHQTLPEDEARRIFRQIASAVYYCHKNQICHRDLKLENILLDEEGNAKIADFGLSNVFDDKRRMSTFCGSPLYASPEIVKGTPYKGPEVDCWSLGVLLYTIVYGTMPFDGRSFKELVSQISEGRYEEPINRSNASPLIRRLLNPDVAQRATIEDVCKDNWLNEGYDTPLLKVAESMSSFTGVRKESMSTTIVCQEKNSKNDYEKPTITKSATQLEEKTEKFTSLLKKNFDDIAKTNEAILQKQKPNFYEKILDYDVRFVLNRIVAVVEATVKTEKISNNLDCSKSNVTRMCNVEKKEENTAEKTDSAYIIPIFEVTSTIPNTHCKKLNYGGKNPESNDIISTITSKLGITKPLTRLFGQKKQDQENVSRNTQGVSQFKGKVMNTPGDTHKENMAVNVPSTCESSLKNSQKPFYLEQSHLCKQKCQSRKPYDNPSLRNQSQRNKLGNDNLSIGPKPTIPFMRTKHHVASLAKILSLNYEKFLRNSFRVPTCKKKLPGKITIPPTFDPNNPSSTLKKAQEGKKDMLIFPSVSVSENKEKIQKKIEKIKKAALDKNLIIRSDSKTRVRIEEYIRSQVKRIQDLVCDEHRSLHGSLENLDEQSLHDLSELYYCAYGSENTDSGIANAEEDEYFCFLCSKLNFEEGISGVLDSFISDSIRKGSLYTSNHLHIPRAKEHDKCFYSLNSMNLEFGSLSKCKSEIQFPNEYLNYISANNRSDLSKKASAKQIIQKDNIGNTKCFLTTSSATQNVPDLRILRSASYSAGLHLSKNTFEVLKINTECCNNLAEKYNLLPHSLPQTQSIGGKYFETFSYETQSTATDATFMNKSQILDKDDGIGDSNESFQSYMETPENFEKDSVLTRSMSYQSCTNFTNNNSSTSQLSPRKFLNHSDFERKYGSKCGYLERGSNGINIRDSSDFASWARTLDDEEDFTQYREGKNALKRRNTMSCLHNKNRIEEDLDLNNSSNEFENYLWNVYKEQLLQNHQDYSEYSSSPNLNCSSFSRKGKFKNRDSKSMDYINGDSSNHFMPKEFYHLAYPAEESDEISSAFQKASNHSNIARNHSHRPGSRLNRTKSLCADILTNTDADDVIQKLRQERKLSCSGTKFESNSPFMSNFLKDLEEADQKRKKHVSSNKKRFPPSNLPKNKQSKANYKKSFLQLLALKRIEEAQKELDKTPRTELLKNEENESNSLLEALKTHGYKGVISQRFQEPDDDFLDSFQMKYLKSPRKLRAQFARMNFMNYDSLPRYALNPLQYASDPLQYASDPLQYTSDPLQYTIDPFEENNYFYNELDYTRNLLCGLPTTSHCDPPYEYRRQSKQSAYDCNDITQIDEYINYLKSNAYYNSEGSTPTSETRRCYKHRAKEDQISFGDDITSELRNTKGDLLSNKTGWNTNKENSTSKEYPTSSDAVHANSFQSDDERQESVHDRIWRKSFYPRFNNRKLSRKERLSFIDPESSESRLGFLNSRYSPSFKSGHEKSELLQRNGSNKSFHSKPTQIYPSSLDKFESRGSVKKKSVKTVPEIETVNENKESSLSKTFKKFCNSSKKEDPEH